MSEFTWYSRLAVYGGCLVLIAQAVTGHGVALLTVLAVIAATLGLMMFIGGLISDARPEAAVPVDRVDQKIETSDEPAPVDAAPAAQQLKAESVIVPQGEGVPTFRVDAAHSAGERCTTCASSLETGQIAAVCRECGSLHHANCWIDNDFHCALPGCEGEGSLQRTARNPLRGPSKP